MTDVPFRGSCGSLAIARTVLTGELNAQSDITCASAVLLISSPFVETALRT